MKRLLSRWILPGVLLVLAAPLGARVNLVHSEDLVPTPLQSKAALIVNKVLERYHYKKLVLDDEFASTILKGYLDALDPNRSFFLQRDIDRFAVLEKRLDDELKRGNLEIPFSIFRTYRERVDERVNKALTLIEKSFNFNESDEYLFDRAKAPWPKDEAEQNEIWRKRIKNDFLTLRLSGKSDSEIRTALRKRYEGLWRRISQFTPDDVFQSFVNAYTQSLEPHTSYMSPSTSENFDISMRLSLEGIGAVLRTDNEQTVVQKTIPGGPAEQSNQIRAGDRIVGVAQGLNGAMEDVVGWRLQDVVDLIRGPKGSVVRLQILPKSAGAEGKVREVSLVRKEIELEDQAAKLKVTEGLEGMNGVRIGVIEVPAFYRDFRAESKGNKDFRSTTRDVRALLQQVEKEQVAGVVIDLRGNGGGSLTEATELTGLFIDTGPVVQVKDASGKVEVEQDPDPSSVYAGPLAVLVDRNSASASEIFAGAIQDYQRGIVIGEPTFGKGTVQTLVDLNRFVTENGDRLGRLRLTMAEFFRISGSSTQLRGVVPDILYPTAQDSARHGERALTNALPWGHIQPAQYQARGAAPAEDLRTRSLARIGRDPGFAMLAERERLLREVDEQKVVSLDERKRREETKRRDKVLKDQKNQFLRSRGVEPSPGDGDGGDEVSEKETEAINRIQLNEAARILADYIRLTSEPKPLAAMRD